MTAPAFRLPIDSAFDQFQGLMTPQEHTKRYGFDLAWIAVRGERVVCTGCGDRLPVGNEHSLVMKSVLYQKFINEHAECVLVDSQPRRAS